MAPDPLAVAIARGALALVFAAAALHKGRDPRAFTAALRGHQLAPDTWARPLAFTLVAAETSVALGLVLPGTATFAAAAGAALLALYATAIAVNLARGLRDIDCGCSWRPQPLSGRLLARNAALIAVAALASTPPAPRAVGALDAFAGAAALATLALLWGAAGALAAVPSPSLPTRAPDGGSR